MRRVEAIPVRDVVGNEICVASGDGDKVYLRLCAALSREAPVLLSFLHVTVLTPAFLNAAIGQLFGRFNEEEIQRLITVEDLSSDDCDLLSRVAEIAKEYYRDPERFDLAVREALEEWDDEN